MMMIGKNGGRFDSLNKIGESINSLEVGSTSYLDDDTRCEISVSYGRVEVRLFLGSGNS